MTDRKLTMVGSEVTDENGVRRQLSDDGESWMRLEDLARWLLSLDLRGFSDPTEREAVGRFQREAVALAPAAQHRAALALLESFGCNTSNLQLKPKAVR